MKTTVILLSCLENRRVSEVLMAPLRPTTVEIVASAQPDSLCPYLSKRTCLLAS